MDYLDSLDLAVPLATQEFQDILDFQVSVVSQDYPVFQVPMELQDILDFQVSAD